MPASVKKYVADNLSQAGAGNFSMWRVANVTVHSKLVLIDDAFVSIGSANFWDSSMLGQDAELNVVGVDAHNLVTDLRTTLWADHMRVSTADADGLSIIDPAVKAELADLSKSLAGSPHGAPG